MIVIPSQWTTPLETPEERNNEKKIRSGRKSTDFHSTLHRVFYLFVVKTYQVLICDVFAV